MRLTSRREENFAGRPGGFAVGSGNGFDHILGRQAVGPVAVVIHYHSEQLAVIEAEENILTGSDSGAGPGKRRGLHSRS